MTVPTIPAFAHIQGLTLAITMRERDQTRMINRKGGHGADASELWTGSIAFAPMTRANGAALVAFFEALDGRVSPFLISLAGGFASQSTAFTGTIAANGRAGLGYISASLSPVGSLVRAGTLIGIGDPQTSSYQWCEVLTDVVASSATAIDIAPRLRKPVTAGATLALGTVYGKFNLASDDIKGLSANVAATGFSIDVIEARA